MSDTITVALILAGPAYLGFLYTIWQGRRTEKKVDAIAPLVPVVEAVVTKLDENTKLTAETHDAVNGQSEALLKATDTIARAEGVLQGVAEEKARQTEK